MNRITDFNTHKQETICIYTNNNNTGVAKDWTDTTFDEAEKFSCIDFGTAYTVLNNGDYWTTFVLDKLDEFRIVNEIFIAVKEPSIGIAELYLFWKECGQVDYVNPNYPLGTDKVGLLIDNGFCIPCPGEPSKYKIIEEGGHIPI